MREVLSQYVVSFNSLFEMPRFVGTIRMDSATSTLSILYLRCRGRRRLDAVRVFKDAFNSLFEMPGGARLAVLKGAAVGAFNSLFEMPESSDEEYSGDCGMFFQFSI